VESKSFVFLDTFTRLQMNFNSYK